MNCNNQPSRPDSYASSDGNGPSASGNASQPIQNIPMMMVPGTTPMPPITPEMLAYLQLRQQFQLQQQLMSYNMMGAAPQIQSVTASIVNTTSSSKSDSSINNNTNPSDASVHPTHNTAQTNTQQNDTLGTITNIVQQNNSDGVGDDVGGSEVSNEARSISPPQFYKGQIMTVEEFDNTMTMYGVQTYFIVHHQLDEHIYADIVSALAARLVIIPWPISTKIPPVYFPTHMYIA